MRYRNNQSSHTTSLAVFYLLLSVTLLLNGCYAIKDSLTFEGTSVDEVGPESSTKIMTTPGEQSLSGHRIQKELEIIVPVFDPNIPKDPNKRKKEGIWPELRRVESVNFALNMKKALENTNQVGAVRVTPNRKVAGDLYVIGKINESNGEDVAIHIKVVSVDGRIWLKKNYKHRVDEYFYTSVRNQGKSPYDPVFKKAAADIVEQLRRKDQSYLEEINQLTEVRFAYSMSDESFRKFLNFNDGPIKLVQAPADNDPMFKRIHQYRVEDQLFTDKMQQYYYDFDQKVKTSYKTWQEAALSAVKAQREARIEAIWRASAGIAAIGLSAIIGAKQGDSTAGKILSGGVALTGTGLLVSGALNYEESKFHYETLMELGKSIDVDVAPQVIEFEEKNIKLNGDATAQFNQWRGALRKIYAEEKTPDKQL